MKVIAKVFIYLNIFSIKNDKTYRKEIRDRVGGHGDLTPKTHKIHLYLEQFSVNLTGNWQKEMLSNQSCKKNSHRLVGRTEIRHWSQGLAPWEGP